MSKIFPINPDDPMPLYAQLTRAIRFAVTTGRLQVGEQLPTVRQLAVDLRINANTVAKVYSELERSGEVKTHRGVGTFVSARHFDAKERPRNERELRDLSERYISEAAALGFTFDDLLDHLQSRRKKEMRRNG